MPGGPRTGAGRKPVAAPRSKSLNIRLTEQEHKRLLSIGGAAWVRKQLGQAKNKEVRISQQPGGFAELVSSPAFDRLSAGERYSFLEDALSIVKAEMASVEPTIGLGD